MLLIIIKKKIADENVIWLIKQILKNFECELPGKGMPLGNYTSQFFANVYLNELDYFVKHRLKARYYIRYVDDFVILHRRKKLLEVYKGMIDEFLSTTLKLTLHPDKSQVIHLRDGLTFVGYRIFYYNKRLRKRNMRRFMKSFEERLKLYGDGVLPYKIFIEQLQGWFGYAQWANTYKFRKEILERINFIKWQRENI